jgi:hypothetical protein
LGAPSLISSRFAHGGPRTPAVARGGDAKWTLSLLSTEPGKPPARSSYTMNVDENGHAELRVGANVPIGANTRQDVGLLLRAHARPSGDALLLDTTTELSQREADGAIRKLAMRSEVLASPGVEAEAASLEDPVSHRRTTVRVSATRLR